MDSRQYPSQASNLVAALPPAPPQSSTKKRRASASGGRGVAHLTPEQLAKKRANDREAQRAIRERTKGQIEQLEKRILELTTQKPYQELQNAIRQKELVEAENEEIKKKLASVLSIIQPICSASGSGLLGSFLSSCIDLNNSSLMYYIQVRYTTKPKTLQAKLQPSVLHP